MVKTFGNVVMDEVGLTREAYADVLQALMDARAAERGYDSVASCISYRGDLEEPQFADEAAAMFSWRTRVWRYANAELDRVLSGLRSQPTIADFVAEVQEQCPFTWP